MSGKSLAAAILSFLLGVSVDASAAPMIYTFEGTVTGVVDQTGGITITEFSAGDAVTYRFLVDFSAPGQHTQFDGDTFNIPEAGFDDYFYAQLLTAESSPTLPRFLPATNLNVDEFRNYGRDWSGPPPGGPFGWLYANSFYNTFQIYQGKMVKDWTIGEAVAGQSRSMIFEGNTTFTDIANFSLNLTSIASPIPEPETYAMLLAGLALLGFATRRRERRATA